MRLFRTHFFVLLTLLLIAGSLLAQERLPVDITALGDLKSKLGVVGDVDLSMTVNLRKGRGELPVGFTLAPAGSRLTLNGSLRREGERLRILELKIKGSEPFRMGDKRLNQLHITRQGHLILDIKGSPDLHVTKIKKKSNGGLELVVKGKPDIDVEPNGKMYMWGFLKVGTMDAGTMTLLRSWPPTLESLMEMPSRPEYGDYYSLARNAATLDFNARMTVNPSNLGRVEANGMSIGDLSTRGGTIVATGHFVGDGAGLRAVGSANRVEGSIGVVAEKVRTSSVHIEKATGSVGVDGHYTAYIPADKAIKPDVTFNGRITYDLSGIKTLAALPNGGAVRVERLSVTGEGNARFDGKKLHVTDGRFKTRADGPVVLHGVRLGDDIKVSRLVVAAALGAEGTYKIANDKLDLEATIAGSIKGQDDREGIVDVLEAGRLRGKLAPGSEVTVDGRTKLSLPLGKTNDVTRGAEYEFDGRIGFGLDGRDISMKLSDGTNVEVERMTLDGSMRVEANPNGVKASDGRFDAHVTGRALATDLKGGTVTADRLPLDVDIRSTGTFDAANKDVATRTHSTGTARLTETIPLKWGTGLDGEVKEGSTIDFDLTSESRTRDNQFSLEALEGKVQYRLKVGDLDLAYPRLRAALKGEGTLDIDQDFSGVVNPETQKMELNRSSGQVAADLALKPGTTITYLDKEGKETTAVVTGPSSVAFTLGYEGKDGKTKVSALENTNVLLRLGETSGRIGSIDLSAPGQKDLELTGGRIVFLENGMDIYGDLKLHIHGTPDAPTVRIRW